MSKRKIKIQTVNEKSLKSLEDKLNTAFSTTEPEEYINNTSNSNTSSNSIAIELPEENNSMDNTPCNTPNPQITPEDKSIYASASTIPVDDNISMEENSNEIDYWPIVDDYIDTFINPLFSKKKKKCVSANSSIFIYIEFLRKIYLRR